jgi:hypothetical protein
MLTNEIIKEVSHKFNNGVVVVNTTPHPLTFEDSVTKELVTVASNMEALVNAKAIETEVRPHFVKTIFEPNEDGKQKIKAIKDCLGEEAVIIGSMIAAQAYPGDVFGMTPCPGYERVAPSEKRMSDSKFTTFE